MLIPRVSLALGLWSGLATAAALVPISVPKPSLPVPGIELNSGQAKPGILFLSRGTASLAVSAQSVFFSPLGAQLNLVASNSNPVVRFADPLPGVMNSFTGTDTRKWITGAARYSTANLSDVYPGIDAQYVLSTTGHLTLRLLLRTGIDLSPVVFEIPQATAITVAPDETLRAKIGPTREAPQLIFPTPVAFQDSPSGRVSRTVRYVGQSSTRFNLQSDSPDRTLPMQVEIPIAEFTGVPYSGTDPDPVVDAAGNVFRRHHHCRRGRQGRTIRVRRLGLRNLHRHPQPLPGCRHLQILQNGRPGLRHLPGRPDP